MIPSQVLKGSGVHRLARLDGVRSAVDGDDGDEFCLLEGLERGVVAGFEEVGKEDGVVADGVGGREGFDEMPSLGGGPGARGVVEEVHFEDLGGGLLNYFLDSFCEVDLVQRITGNGSKLTGGSLSRLDSTCKKFQVGETSSKSLDAFV